MASPPQAAPPQLVPLPSADAQRQPIEGVALQSLSLSLGQVVQDHVHEFMAWFKWFQDWHAQHQLSGQAIPPQAFVDYEKQTGKVLAFLQQFSQPAALLAGAGAPEFAARLNQYWSGLTGLFAQYSATVGAMQQSDFATGQAVQQIYTDMRAFNTEQAGIRLGLQQGAAQHVFDVNAKILEDQQVAFDKRHADLTRLFGS